MLGYVANLRKVLCSIESASPLVGRFSNLTVAHGHPFHCYVAPLYRWTQQTASGAEISRLIKMLTSDNVRDMAFKLGKASHAHPLVFAEKVINQLERYFT